VQSGAEPLWRFCGGLVSKGLIVYTLNSRFMIR
jgi:hypothetical protein